MVNYFIENFFTMPKNSLVGIFTHYETAKMRWLDRCLNYKGELQEKLGSLRASVGFYSVFL